VTGTLEPAVQDRLDYAFRTCSAAATSCLRQPVRPPCLPDTQQELLVVYEPHVPSVIDVLLFLLDRRERRLGTAGVNAATQAQAWCYDAPAGRVS
jgi:hypothetical protein